MRTQYFLIGSLLAALSAAQETPTFRSDTNLVIVNVVARDKDGKPVEGLRKEDFTILENGKQQSVSVFEFQRLSMEQAGAVTLESEGTTAKPAAAAPAAPKPEVSGAQRFRDRRLMILYFDFSGMSPAEQLRTKTAARKFVRENLTASDIVSVMSFSSTLKTNQEFTADRALLDAAIANLKLNEASLTDITDALTSDTTTTSDDTDEMDLFNTDRKLNALQTAMRAFAAIPEKKALVYFSSGAGGSGADNQAQLRSTINAAVRANVSLYPVDVRGLVANPPGGAASSASASGTGLYTGSTQQGQRDTQIGEQDTLLALASDTGGKALIDSNDLVYGVTQAQRDIQSYYTLGYYSTNADRDGKYRRVEVKFSNRVQAKLEFRQGYYGDKSWKTYSSTDKERELEEALLLGDPRTELPLALAVNWFRLNPTRFFVPVAVRIPGSALPLDRKGDNDVTQFDFIAEVRDSGNRVAATMRDFLRIKLTAEKAELLRHRSILYDTGFTLAPGVYRVRFLARENSSGKIGTFETKFTVPNAPQLSSVVWSSQREPMKEALANAEKDKKTLANHPLIQNGQKLVPSVTHTFRSDATVFVYLEMYDPQAKPAPSVAASVSIFDGKKKVFESEPVVATTLAQNRNGAMPLELQLSLGKLAPGRYTAQVNVIDQTGRKFVWDRSEVVVVR